MCHSYSYGLRAIIQCLPAWFRFIQCLRRYRDTKRAFPHLVNAGKYSTTFFVVTFAALYATHRGRAHKYEHKQISFLCLVDSRLLVWSERSEDVKVGFIFCQLQCFHRRGAKKRHTLFVRYCCRSKTTSHRLWAFVVWDQKPHVTLNLYVSWPWFPRALQWIVK